MAGRFCALTCLCILLGQSLARVDKTRESGSHGQAVTQAAIKLIQDTCIFPNDNQFLRRLAWVSTEFGDKPDSFTGANLNKGIWSLDEQNFDTATKKLKTTSHITIESISRLGIDPTKLSFKHGDLMVPLQGALATRAFLELGQNPVIPFTVEDQATYWKNFYKPYGNAQDFVDAVNKIPNGCSAAGADILFMIDSSGSICPERAAGCDNYEKAKLFVKGVVNSLPFGPRSFKWAVDIFSTTPQHPIHFNSYNGDVELLRKKIDDLHYIGLGTRTDLALKEAVGKSFTTGFGARDPKLGYPRVVVLLTDGLSNEPEKTKVAAEIAKQNGLVIFTVGIGSVFTDHPEGKEELDYMASYPKCMHMYLMRNYQALLQGFVDELRIQTCGSSSMITVGENGTVIVNSVGKDQYMYFDFNTNSSAGATFDVSMNKGSATLYLSGSERNPSEVIYDYKVDATQGKNGQIYIDPKKFNETRTLKDAVFDKEDTVPVYGSIKGNTDKNNFTITVTPGDHSNGVGRLTSNLAIAFIALVVLNIFIL